MKRRSRYLLIGLIIGGLGGLIFYLTKPGQPTTPDEKPVIVSPTQSPTGESSPPPTTPTPVVTTPTPVQEDWQILTSSEHEFSIQHPSEMEVGETGRGGVELLLTGPSQEPNTELFDGIRLTFSLGNYQQNEFMSFVEQQRQEQLQQPTTENISEIDSVTIADRQGYQFVSTGPFGDTRYIYLPAGENEYLVILEAVFDPTSQGFQQTVQTMYQTLEVRE